MKPFLLAAVLSLMALSIPAQAYCPQDIGCPDWNEYAATHNWVLLGLHSGMGAIIPYTKFPDLPPPTFSDDGVPWYPTKAACQSAMREHIAHFSGKSHAEGNFGRYLCTDVRTWTSGQ
jgi:hypothetical protein